MRRAQFALISNLHLVELAAYQNDIDASLRLCFSPTAPDFPIRFLGYPKNKVAQELQLRLAESDIRSTLIVLTSLEASFRVDFHLRCRERLKDELSRYFREIEKTRGDQVRFDEDILEGWKKYIPGVAPLIGRLHGALKLRHWVAHGRYWHPKLGRKYDFDSVYDLAEVIASTLHLTS